MDRRSSRVDTLKVLGTLCLAILDNFLINLLAYYRLNLIELSSYACIRRGNNLATFSNN
ncbi:hypothetical protein [Daejeonella sp.]|uniref:hypothetical protein n=1 Tax=Daejeonella sp. TaxID=2805397 RepID=UPI003C7450A8